MPAREHVQKKQSESKAGAVLGELVQTTAGKWITHPPSRCPSGHTLGPGKVLVGHQACLGHEGGHTTWTCRTCDQTVYGPPLNTHCTTLGGPAVGETCQMMLLLRRCSTSL